MRQLFEDKYGDLSSMRFVVNITAILFFVQWIVELITTFSFKPTAELTHFVIAVVVGKGIQAFAER